MQRIPFYGQQTEWTCGAACVRMVFAFFGIKKSENAWVRELKTKRDKSGTLHKNIVVVAEKYKRTYIVARNARIADLRSVIKQGYLVIVGYWLVEHNCAHYAVVRKIDGKKVHLLDPWYGPRQAYSPAAFKKVWRDGEGEKGWFVGIK